MLIPDKLLELIVIADSPLLSQAAQFSYCRSRFVVWSSRHNCWDGPGMNGLGPSWDVEKGPAVMGTNVS